MRLLCPAWQNRTRDPARHLGRRDKVGENQGVAPLNVGHPACTGRSTFAQQGSTCSRYTLAVNRAPVIPTNAITVTASVSVP